MAAPSTFLDRLSPEVRVIIYAFVFSPSPVVKPGSSDTALGFKKRPDPDTAYPKETDTYIDTAILTVSKPTYTEAIPVFYRDKTIRGSTRDFRLLLQNADFSENVRHVEIAECITCYEDHDFRSILRRLQILPNARSVTILSDCLNFLMPNPDPMDFEYFTVPDFCARADLGEATCVDIGRYQPHGSFSKVQFAHRRLVQLWPEVTSTPVGYDAFEDFESIRAQWTSQGNSWNFTRWCLQTSLRCWVGLHDAFLAIEISGEVPTDDAKVELLRDFTFTIRNPSADDLSLISPIPAIPSGTDLKRRFLGKITPQDGHELLSWATERLAINITTTYALWHDIGIGPRWIMRSHWSETDGCMATIEFMLIHQNIARAGLPDRFYVQDPVRPEKLHCIAQASRLIHDAQCWGIAAYASQTSIIEDFGDLETKQLAHLSMALSRQGEPVDDEYWADRDAWAADLLRRYILASGTLGAAETTRLHKTPLHDLQKIVREVLLTLASDCKFDFLWTWSPMRTYAPEDFDEELYEPFAWLYGRLLRCTCRRYFHTGTVEGYWSFYFGELWDIMQGNLTRVWGEATAGSRFSSKYRRRRVLGGSPS